MGIISRVKSVFTKSSPTPTQSKSSYQDPGAGGKGAGTYYTSAYQSTPTPPQPPGRTGGSSSSGGGTPVASTPTGTLLSTGQIVPQSIPPPTSTKPSGKTIQGQFKQGVSDPTLMSRQPTAKEEVLQMSIPSSKIRTEGSFKEDAFYGEILSQRKAFESSPTSSPFGMSTPQGESYFFIPNVGLAEGVSQQAFSELPRGERYSLRTKDIGVGLGKGILEIGEFGASVLGSGFKGQIKEGEDLKPLSLGLDLGIGRRITRKTNLGREFTDIPLSTYGKVAEIVPAGYFIVKGGISFLSGLGKGGGITSGLVQAGGMFTPLRPVPGLYVSPNNQFKAFGTRQVLGRTEVTRIIGTGYRGEPSLFISEQKLVNVPGTGYRYGQSETTLLREATLISPTGRITQGLQISKVTGLATSPDVVGDVKLFTDKGGFKVRQPLESFSGGISDFASMKRYSIFLKGELPGTLTGFGEVTKGYEKLYRGAFVSRPTLKEDLFEFASGSRSDILTKTGIVFRTRPNIRGYIKDLNVGTFAEESGIVSFRGTGTKTPLSKTFGEDLQLKSVRQQSLSQQLGSIQATIQPQIQPSITRQVLRLSSPTRQSEKQLSRQFQVTTQSLGLGQFERIRQDLGLINIPRTGSSLRDIQKQFSIVIPALGTQQITRQTTKQFTSIIPRTTLDIPPSFRFGGGLFLPPSLLNLQSFPGRGSSLLGRFTSRYSPSLTSSTFRLFGRPSSKALRTGIVTPFERRYLLGSQRRRKKGGKKRR